LKYLLVLTLAALACSRQTEPLRPTIADSTVCALAAAPERFRSGLVKVHGRIVSDGIEHDSLVSEECRAVALGVVFRENASGADTVKRFLYGPNAHADQTLTATFVGHFSTTSGKRVLEVVEVSDIQVTKP